MNRSGEQVSVALIGMAGRFPGAETLRDFWRNLVDGREAVRFATPDELQAAGVDPDLIANPDYVPAISQIDDPENFDANFFGFSAREAEIIDPQQRVFLECAWSALEDAACDPNTYPGAIGVFAGAGMNSYVTANLMGHPELLTSVGPYQVMVGNDKDFLCSRTAYKLNLRGPAVTVQTACSTSLVAVKLAFESLLRGECDMALAGGVSIPFPRPLGYLYMPGMIYSRDGHCRAFDAAASGIVPAGGAGVVALKRLDDAIADNDHIYAILRGAAVNNDGASKVGYSAPSVEGQEAVIRQSMEMAGFDPKSVHFVEAHGTGTEVGDPIEITALSRAFRADSNNEHWCALGALKTNLGHLDAAAGVAGLIKTALAVHNRTIPPTLNFEKPNPLIELEKTPFYINTEAEPYRGQEPFRAGISSFGIGGTNAHVSLEEAPAAVSDVSQYSELIVLSAKSPAALDARMSDLQDYLEQDLDANFADLAYTLAIGRQPFGYRQALPARNVQHLLGLLRNKATDPEVKKLRSEQVPADRASVAFLFPGQGAQYVRMGQGLYDDVPQFREIVDTCCSILQPILGLDLRTILYPAPGMEEDAERQLRQTSITQPALFTIEYAMAQLWMRCGIMPSAMIGHSIGEYVAACLADVFSLQDALALVAERGRLMQSQPSGIMLAINLTEFNLTPLLPSGVSIAAINSENQTVASGAEEDIVKLEAALQKKGIRFTRLRSSHAFHSAMMDPIVGVFVEKVAQTPRQKPALRWLSNVSGTWITAEEAVDPNYWGAQLRSAVRFADCAKVLLKETEAIPLEVGPGETLSTLMRAQSGAKRPVVSSMRHASSDENDREHWLTALGMLWIKNVSTDWKGFYAGQRRLRISLPAYPFERRRYCIEPAKVSPVADSASAPAKKNVPSEWLYVPSWKRIAMKAVPVQEDGLTLVFRNEDGRWNGAVNALREAHRTIEVQNGESNRSTGPDSWQVNCDRLEDLRAFFEELQARGQWPSRIVCFPTADAERSLAQAMFLVQGVTEVTGNDSIHFTIVLDRANSILGEKIASPDANSLSAYWRVVPLECPNLTVRVVDVDATEQETTESILREVALPGANELVACRRTTRWQRIFEPIHFEESSSDLPGGLTLREAGVYLITGGTGTIGLLLARHIAQNTKGTLVLTGRAAVPPKEQWEDLLNNPETAAQLKAKIRGLQAISDAGGTFVTVQAEAGDPTAMRKLLAELSQQYGAVHGIIHAAGTVSRGAICDGTRDELRAMFSSKVEAAEWITECIGQPDLDFVLFCSSISAVLPTLGLASYCAANAWLDGFATMYDNPAGTRVMSINWDRWRDPEWMVNPDVPAALEGVRKGLEQYAIRPSEGLVAFDKALSYPVPQLVISTRDLEQVQRATMHSAAKSATTTKSSESSSAGGHSGVEVLTGSDNEIEAVIMSIWEELLGVPVHLEDNFFELGGHSLNGVQVLSRVRERFGVNLPLRSLFELVTPLQLAERIRLMHWALNPVQEVESTEQREEIGI